MTTLMSTTLALPHVDTEAAPCFTSEQLAVWLHYGSERSCLRFAQGPIIGHFYDVFVCIGLDLEGRENFVFT